jgi:two-component system, OmpR family, KDP operon response regulator KdpE
VKVRDPTPPEPGTVPIRCAHIVVATEGIEIDENALATLQLAGHQVALSSGGALPALLAERNADLIAIYGSAGDSEVHNLLRVIRDINSHLPVLVVSPRSSESSVVLAFRAGADDVLQDVARCLELEVRVSALLRRPRLPPTSAIPDREIVVGEFVLDPWSRTLHHDCESHRLSPIQFRIILAVMRAGGRPVTHQQLQSEAGVTGDESHSLRVHILHLRKMIEETPARPKHLLTVPYVGYRFVSSQDVRKVRTPVSPGTGTNVRRLSKSRG